MFGRSHAATIDNCQLEATPSDKPLNQKNILPHALPPLRSSPLPFTPELTDHFQFSSDFPTKSEDELFDLELTYQQFQALYDAGIISSSQLSMGQVARSELQRILDFLQLTESEATLQNNSTQPPHHLEAQLTVDCGLKRVDSSRYRRDYVINRNPGDAPTTDDVIRRTSYTKVCVICLSNSYKLTIFKPPIGQSDRTNYVI